MIIEYKPTVLVTASCRDSYTCRELFAYMPSGLVNGDMPCEVLSR